MAESRTAPKSTFKKLEELLQKNGLKKDVAYNETGGQFVCTIAIVGLEDRGEEFAYTGQGSNKTTAKDTAAEEALAVLSEKLKPYKEAKNSVSKLNELAQKRKLKIEFTDMDKVGDAFQHLCKISNPEGEEVTVEEYTGKGRSKKESKNNAATNALHGSKLLDVGSEVFDMDGDDVIGMSYPQSPSQTGYLLIINFRADRKWAELDEKNILNFFKDNLNFKSSVVIDPTKKELLDELTQTAKVLNEYTANYYCFVFFIMGHGSEFGVTTADKGTKKRTIAIDEITEHFKNEKIPNFVGKPKAFFIQSCRGGERQRTYLEADDVHEYKQPEIRVPRDCDLFIAHATTEGYRSLRLKHVGAIFIHNTINIFERFHKEKHLEEMMIDVKATVAKKNDWKKEIDGVEYGQMPCTWSTLTKRLEFRAPSQILACHQTPNSDKEEVCMKE